MKILNVSIHNYRSICQLDFQCEPMLILLGPNNHGKSNILSAIEFALSSSAKHSLADFNKFCGEELVLWVEITFHELTDQEKVTFKRYLRQNGTFTIRKTAKQTDSGKIETSLNGYCQEPTVDWLKSSAISGLTKREVIATIPLGELVHSSGRITQAQVLEAQKKYIESHVNELEFHEALETTAFIGPPNIGGGVLPDFYFVPAIRDLADEIQAKGSATFYRMLGRTISEIAENDVNFRALREKVDQLAKSLNRKEGEDDHRPPQLIELEKSIEAELVDWRVDVDIEVIPPAFEKFFDFGTMLNIDDGVKTKASDKGHGLQRALIFALFRAWAKSLKKVEALREGTVPRISSESVIYAIEEPELFLHPHAQKKMAQAIKDIAESPNHQILVCSHSSYFVDLDYYKSICIVNKSNAESGTEIRQCVTDLFPGTDVDDRKKRFHAAHWINPDRGEMFFAKKIAFVEGETEKVIFPFLASKMGCYDPEISVIDCGSKFNLPLYISVANAFKLKYVVVHDEDPIPDPIPVEWNAEKRASKQRTFSLNQEIQNSIDVALGNSHMFQPDFEKVSGVSRAQGERKGKALAALEYFSSLENRDIPDKLQAVVWDIYS